MRFVMCGGLMRRTRYFNARDKIAATGTFGIPSPAGTSQRLGLAERQERHWLR